MSEEITFVLNGTRRSVAVDGQDSLLTVLQRDFQLTGARESCGVGVCGACTVEVNGETVSSCLTWAALCDGATVLTIEGLMGGDGLDPMQRAFLDQEAFQCGYCTPGMVMMCRDYVAHNDSAEFADIRHHLAGSICRCGAYPEILAAVRQVLAERRDGGALSTEEECSKR